MSAKNLSMKERARLATKSFANPTPPLAIPSHTTMERKINSGPANSIAAMMSDAKVSDENRLLKEELKTWEQAIPAMKLAPSIVVPSKWANRHSDSFLSAEYEELKADIELSGGNVQAIKVRPIPGTAQERYEIVFGHRRHRACLELGLPVLAVIESINEQALFIEMDRENRQRADLRPYEQGEMYRRALDEGLYSSLRKLAESIGVSLSNVSVAIKIARLPTEVLEAFSSRLDIQYRWATPLADALANDPDIVLTRAKAIALEKPAKAKSAIHIFQTLIGKTKDDSKMSSQQVKVDGATVMVVKKAGKKIAFEIDSLNEDKIEKIQRAILQVLAD